MAFQSRLELVVDSRTGESSLRRFEDRLDRVDRAGSRADASVRNVSGGLDGLRGAAVAASGALAGLGLGQLASNAYEAISSSQKLRASLETVTGSVGAASSAWENLLVFARETPFTLEQSVEGFIRMKSLGLDPTNEALRSFGNTASAMGKDMMQMVEAVADATTGEFERLKEFGIQASKEGERVTFTFQGIETTVANTSESISQYLENIGNTQFADAMERQMDTLGGKASNLQDSIYQLYLEIGEAGATDAFGDSIDQAADAVERLTRAIESGAFDAFISFLENANDEGKAFIGEISEIISQGVQMKNALTASLLEVEAGLVDVRASASAAFAGLVADAQEAVNKGLIPIQQALNYLDITFANLLDNIADGLAKVPDLPGGFELLGDQIEGLRNHADSVRENLIEPTGISSVALDENAQSLRDQAIALRESAEAMRANGTVTTSVVEDGFKPLSEWLFETEQVSESATKTFSGLSESSEKVSSSLERGARAAQGLIDELYPLQASQRQYAEEKAMLVKWAEREGKSNEWLEQSMERLERKYQSGESAAEAYGLTATGAMASVEDAVDPMVTTFERGIERMDDAGVEMWRGFLDGTTDAMESFEDIVLDMLAEVAHNLTTRQIIVPIQAAITGEGQGTAAGQGGLLSTENALKGGKWAYDNVFGGNASTGGGFFANGAQAAGNAWRAYQGIGSTYSGTFGSSLGASSGGGFGAANASLANGALSGVYTAGAGLAGAWAGSQVGGALTDKQANSNYGATAGTAIGAYVGSAVPVIGTAIGAGIGSFIGGIADSLFGSENSPPEFEYEQRTGGGTAYEWGGRNTPFSSTGTFGFEISKMEQEGMDALDDFATGLAQADEALAQFMTDDQIERVQRAMDAFDYEGLSTSDLLADRLDTILTAADMHGPMYDRMRDEYQGEQMSAQRYEVALNIAALESVLTQVPENVANHVDHYMAQSDGGIKALTESLLIQIQQWDALGYQLEQFVPTFDRLAEGAVVATNGVNDLAGGVENLTAMHSSYYDAFFTDAEKFEAKAESLSQQFEAMGVTLPETREGVRDLVEGLDLMTVAGREQYVAIMSMVPALDEYVQGMEQQRIAAEEAAEAERIAAEEARLAAEAEAEAARQRQITLSVYSSGALDSIESALDAYTGASTTLQDIADTRQQQLESERQAIEQLGSLLDSLLLSDQSILDPAERLAEAQRQFADLQVRAEAGDTAAVSELQGASSSYLDAAAAYYGQSSSQYAAIFGEVTGSVEGLERQFEDSVDELGSIESIANRQLAEQQRARQTLIDQLQTQINTLDGINTFGALLETLPASIASQLEGIISTEGKYGSTRPDGVYTDDSGFSGTQKQVNALYQDIFGRNADESGLDYWVGRYADGTSLSRIREEMEAQQADGYFATGGAFTNGIVQRPTQFNMGVMGEAGPEAIMPLSNVGGRLGVHVTGDSDAEMVRELQALRQEVALLRAERSQDAAQAADQRSSQIREQQKTNRNTKQRVATV